MEVVFSTVLLVLGFVMLIKGADFFVEGASGVAEKFGIPQLIVGLTIVAMGTSAPEAAVSITAAIKGNADITIGNIVGSNILNILLILGISAIVVPLAVSGSTIFYEIPFMILITLLLLVQGMNGTVGFREGIALMLLFLLYLGYLFYMAGLFQRKSPSKENMPQENMPQKNSPQKNSPQKNLTQKKNGPGRLTAGTLGGLVLIIAGSQISVDAASGLARFFGMSERFIGLTIVALGTSLPELFTSVSAAGKGNADIAVGNIIGSNIFNILFVVGVSALLTPVSFSKEFYPDTITAAAVGLLLLAFCVRKRKLGRRGGLILLAGYAAYFVFICI